jgi:hypothetical protein
LPLLFLICFTNCCSYSCSFCCACFFCGAAAFSGFRILAICVFVALALALALFLLLRCVQNWWLYQNLAQSLYVETSFADIVAIECHIKLRTVG